MRHAENIDAAPMLPFNNLPPPIPLQVSHADIRPKIVSRFKQIIEECDWNAYEENVLAAMRQAAEKYNQLYADIPSEKVYQVSIWTDPQVQKTAINFETKVHAEAHIRKWATIFRDKYQWETTAAKLEEAGYNENPADFKYREFLMWQHPEIADLSKLAFQYTTHRYAADARISASLRKVAKQIKSLKILDKLPREEMIWLGTNSPRDWYDHIFKV